MSDDQLKPSERGPTNDEIIAEAKRISDLEWEGNEEHADFFGPLLFRLQADTSWFKPVPELLEVTQADRDLWKYLLDAPKSKCSIMDTCDPATAELQAIARHRIEALAKRPRVEVPSEVLEAMRRQGQDEGFASAVSWLRDRSAQKPAAYLAIEADILANGLENSRKAYGALSQEPSHGE